MDLSPQDFCDPWLTDMFYLQFLLLRMHLYTLLKACISKQMIYDLCKLSEHKKLLILKKEQ